MSQIPNYQPNPALDLVLERTVDVPPDLVYKAWTTPEHLKQWFTPRPWTTVECEMDLRPGGLFRAVMRSPEGEEFPYRFCYLELVPNQRLAWTDALDAGFRPSSVSTDVPQFTAIIHLEPVNGGSSTRYTAIAMHRDAGSREKHEKMGFHDGWGTVLTQLVESIKQQVGR